MHQTQHGLVTDQFGPRAKAYVTSAVHAEGEDLDQVGRVAQSHPGGRVLDLGCGGGHVSYRVAPYAEEVTAYDLAADMLAEVARTAEARGLDNIVTSQGAVERLPFPDAGYDLVVSRFSAHHWRDFPAGLREARRMLRPGGHAIFIDAISPGRPSADSFLQTIEMLRDPSHVRDYTAAEWIAALTAAGFVRCVTTPRRLRMEFSSWIARMATPELHAQAIRSLQNRMAGELRASFAIEEDGSFMLDTMTFEVDV
jgi:ubiquinone/menaquinone biosynthesis C-methylase UbiE